MDSPLFDIVVIGGGVVGLGILRAATLAGHRCALVEKEPHILSKASGENSGVACTGVDATPGTLERALIRDSISQIRPFMRALNIPHRECGSLVCQWEGDVFDLRDRKHKSPLAKVLSVLSTFPAKLCWTRGYSRSLWLRTQGRTGQSFSQTLNTILQAPRGMKRAQSGRLVGTTRTIRCWRPCRRTFFARRPLSMPRASWRTSSSKRQRESTHPSGRQSQGVGNIASSLAATSPAYQEIRPSGLSTL